MSGTWFLVEWVFRQHPAELTRLMLTAFVLKLAFLGSYVAVMLRVMQFLPGVQDVDKSILMVPGRNRDSAPGYGRIKSGLLGPPTKWTTLSTCWE